MNSPSPVTFGFGRSLKPTRPLVFLGALLVVIIAGMAVLQPSETKIRRIKVEEVSSPAPAMISMTTVSWDPKTETWGVIHDSTLEGRREFSATALERAANLVHAHSWEHFKTDTVVGGFKPLPIKAVESDPARFRGHPVEVVGTLLSVEPIDVFNLFGFKIGPIALTWSGTLRTRATRHGSEALVDFLMVDEIDGDFPVQPGGECKLQGVFYRLGTGDLDGNETTAIKLLTKRAFESYKTPEPADIDLDTLRDVKDDKTAKTITTNIFREAPLLHLLAASKWRDQESLGECKVYRGRAIQDLLVDPEPHRGEAVEFEAEVLEAQHYNMGAFFAQTEKGDDAVDELWHSFVTADGTIPVRVLSTRPLPANLSDKDRVLVKGIFYRVWGYHAAKGPKRAPLVVAFGDMELLVHTPKRDPQYLLWGLCSLFVVALLVISVVIWRGRRQSDRFQRTRLARHRVLRGGIDLNRVAEAKLAEAGGAPGTTPAESTGESRDDHAT